MAAGVRVESNFLYGGRINSFGIEEKVGTTIRNALLAKLDYSLPIDGGYRRLMFGFMGGLYTIKGIGSKGTPSVSIATNRGVGFAPELGFASGSFKISCIYHFVTGSDFIYSGVPTSSIVYSAEVPRNYFLVNLTLNLFSVGEDEH